MGRFWILATVKNGAVNTGVIMFLIFFGKYQEVELLDHTVILCLTF